MARESKRKREEKRFGRPERLADKVLTMPRGFPLSKGRRSMLPGEFDEHSAKAFMESVDEICEEANRSVVIECSSVASYFAESFGSAGLDWTRDLPSIRPPFPSVFLQVSDPPPELPGYPEDVEYPRSWGWLLHVLDKEGAAIEGSSQSELRSLNWLGAEIQGLEHFLHCVLVEESGVGWLDVGRLSCVAGIDAAGGVLGDPVFAMTFSASLDPEIRKMEIDRSKVLAAPVFLALALMNCRNVSLRLVHPDANQNRLRQKVGRKPFVRYHTIDIDPMKSVLGSEGGVGTNGLKKAIHICRGHFVHRTIPNDVIYWRSPHVRGSAGQGVVISDYNVKSPGVPNVG